MSGVLLCLISAAAFATLGVLGRLAEEEGAGLMTTLLVRFALACAIFLVLLRLTGRLGRLRLPKRVVWTGLVLGAVGYSLQSALYFAALGRLDVSLVSLVLYTYPAFVTVAAVALGRAVLSPLRVAALALASGGLALVLLAAGTGAFDPLGAVIALGASLVYTAYIMVSDRVVEGVDPLALPVLVLCGATASFAVVGVATSSIDLALSAKAWLWLVLIALIPTVVAVSAFFEGLRRVGPSETAILATVEPVVTVVLAFAVLDERLSPLQLAGGALVLCAVVLLQLPARRAAARTRRAARRAAPAASAGSGREVSRV